jgi:hypothetical protein
MIMNERDLERFMSKVFYDTNGGCWLWMDALSPDGYGVFGIKNRTKGAHVYSHEHFIGPVPDGHQVDHATCAVRCCVNPAHIEAVTPAVNRSRRRVQRKPIRLNEVYDFTQPPRSFREVLARLGGCRAVSRETGIPLVNLEKMRARNSIGGRNWDAIIGLARAKRDEEINLHLFCRLSAEMHARP